MDFNEDELDSLDSDTQMVGLFFRLATTPLVAVWLGAGPVKVGANVLDPTGQMYQGMGQLPNIPAFKSLLNGQAERIDIGLSGVDDDVFALAAGDSGEVRGKAASIGIGFFDPRLPTASGFKSPVPMLGPVHWIRRGVVDQMTVSRAPAKSPGDVTTQAISISIGSITTGRRRARYSYWSPQDQEARSPGDRFCERTVRLSGVAQKVWPSP
jgi:hypothetical protein